MDDLSTIIKTEYSERFDEIRKKMMLTSYFKYGPVLKNYKSIGGLQSIPSLKARLKEYEATGNTELLADVANFAMIEFMYPQHPNGHYKESNDIEQSRRTTVGISVNEMSDIKNGNGDWWS